MTERDGSRAAMVVLPELIADQALCGRPVDRAAISAGDLVFWDFRELAPKRVGVAVDATTVITVDPVDPVVAGVVRMTLSESTAIGVKRVLESGDG
ncbi:hypothetical protein [Nocardia brasiliensis]|uniref:hypothetical protein n=1 Tax=Nocardia brasiliensis TaxID=37326 RepID=UPI003D8EF857